MLNFFLFFVAISAFFYLYHIYEEKDENEDEEEKENKCKETERERKFSLSSLFSSISGNLEGVELSLGLDKFSSLEKVVDACKSSGLSTCNLIIGIDFSASNFWKGRKSFGNLHKTSGSKVSNPYQKILLILSKTMELFDEDGLIPAFGFGDENSRNTGTFPLSPSGCPCEGFAQVLENYNKTSESVYMAGPTSFAPMIEKAVDMVKELKSFHLLIIISDGEMNNEEMERSQKAIIEASFFPLSIVIIGVGDGPWNKMDKLENGWQDKKKFSNVTFVDYNKISTRAKNPEAILALNVLLDVPDQIEQLVELGLMEESEVAKLNYEKIKSNLQGNSFFRKIKQRISKENNISK